MKQYKVTFQPSGQVVSVPEGSSVMDALNLANIYFDFPCGGNGKCGKCQVEIQEEILLACATKVNKDLVVELNFNQSTQHQILSTSDTNNLKVQPHIIKTHVEVGLPSLEEPTPDWLRVKEALAQKGFKQEELKIQYSELRDLPKVIRDSEQHITAVIYGSEVIRVERGDTTPDLLGMAFDIGTTTIVGYLMNLKTGQELAVASTINPQTKYGADVISRITFASSEEGLTKLHQTVIGAINQIIAEACGKAEVSQHGIYSVTIAGNTTMHHLFLGINPKYLSTSPYVSVYNDPIQVKPIDLQLNINPGGRVFVLPNIGGFVGADTTAVLLTTAMDESKDIKLMIDIGTNGELALGSSQKMVSTSAAAGPAFEGAEITYGMRGADGAIDHVFFRETLEYTVIGTGLPKGICGSALLDVIAGLIELGIINERGKILSPEKITNPQGRKFAENIIKYEEEDAFLLVEGSKTQHGKPIVVTQGDIRQLQLAKGAMVAGIKILLDKLEISVGDVQEVLLAGAFGNYMNPHSACTIGLIPKELENSIKMIGNAAGQGAKIALLSADEYQKAAEIVRKVEHVELATHPQFRTIFAKSTYFSKPSEK